MHQATKNLPGFETYIYKYVCCGLVFKKNTTKLKPEIDLSSQNIFSYQTSTAGIYLFHHNYYSFYTSAKVLKLIEFIVPGTSISIYNFISLLHILSVNIWILKNAHLPAEGGLLSACVDVDSPIYKNNMVLSMMLANDM